MLLCIQGTRGPAAKRSIKSLPWRNVCSSWHPEPICLPEAQTEQTATLCLASGMQRPKGSGIGLFPTSGLPLRLLTDTQATTTAHSGQFLSCQIFRVKTHHQAWTRGLWSGPSWKRGSKVTSSSWKAPVSKCAFRTGQFPGSRLVPLFPLAFTNGNSQELRANKLQDSLLHPGNQW